MKFTSRILLLLLAVSLSNATESGPAPIVDLIVSGDYVVTMDESHTLITDGAIAINNGRIVAIDSYENIAASYRAREMLDGKDRVVMPGLINGHTHAAMTLLRGIADDRDLMDWLQNYIFPTEVRFVDEEFVRIGTELACWEMIRGGTTTFVDMYFFPDVIASVVDKCGLRAVIATAIIEQKSPGADNWQQSFSQAKNFIKRWQGKNNRIIPAFGPHAAYTISPEHLQELRSAANRLAVPISIHISETRAEVKDILKRYGRTPVAHLDKLGFFNGATIGAHVVWPEEQEILTLARRKVGVIHNPTSNMKIASGFSPVPRMIEQGVVMGLGTDGAASNNDLDMWEEIRLAAFIHKGKNHDAKIMPAQTVLGMATLSGAEAIGLGDEIGAITVGRRADLIQISLTEPHLIPIYDIISHLAYVTDAQDVISVIVDGKVLMREQEVLTIDKNRVRKQAQAIAAKIKEYLRRNNN